MENLKQLMLMLAISTAFMSFSTNTYAMHHEAISQHKHAKGDIINVKVHGMVCDFCATAIKKRFMKQKAVKDVKVDLDNMTISIEHMPGKTLSEKTIKKEVKKAGYKYKGLVKSE